MAFDHPSNSHQRMGSIVVARIAGATRLVSAHSLHVNVGVGESVVGICICLQ